MHHDVSQQRNLVLPQASISLLYSVRLEKLTLFSKSQNKCGNGWLMLQMVHINLCNWSLPQVFCYFFLSWFSTSRFWLSWPVTTPFLFTTSSPGLCRVLAVQGPSSLWVGSSSCCWRCPTASGRGVSLTRTAAASVLEVMLHFTFPKDVLAKRWVFVYIYMWVLCILVGN